MATGLLSKGIALKANETALTNLLSIPDIGGSVEKVEITTLADGSRRYINGIKDYGELAFEFVYDNKLATDDFRVLTGFEASGESVDFELSFPDGTSFAFSGQCSVVVAGKGVNEAMTFTLNVSLNSDIAITHPAA